MSWGKYCVFIARDFKFKENPIWSYVKIEYSVARNPTLEMLHLDISELEFRYGRGNYRSSTRENVAAVKCIAPTGVSPEE